jgi:hypothetical protein
MTANVVWARVRPWRAAFAMRLLTAVQAVCPTVVILRMRAASIAMRGDGPVRVTSYVDMDVVLPFIGEAATRMSRPEGCR